jgi:hypothetical protein
MSDTDKTGGPAFPVQLGTQHDQYYAETGMTLRDYFAAQVMGHMISLSIDRDGGWHHDVVAYGCYQLADAMIRARSNFSN